MSGRKRSTAVEADDLVDAPFLDDAERAESAWLLARENNPSAAAPSSKVANDYAELEDLLGGLPPGPSDESWHDQVLAMASTSRPWWRRPVFLWGTAGAFVAAAALAMVLLQTQPPAELQVAIYHVDVKRGDFNEAVVGDRLVVTARPRGAANLRVFRSDGTPVARCPNGPGCRVPVEGEYAIDITLDAPVRYQVILVVGMRDAGPDGTMDRYVDAARRANARIVMYQPIDAH